jgi:hypothetical protein
MIESPPIFRCPPLDATGLATTQPKTTRYQLPLTRR